MIDALLLCALSLQDQGVQVVAESVPVRAGSDPAYAQIGAVTGGQLYVSTSRANGFHKIWYNRAEGWIHESALAPASLSYDAVTIGTNVRSGPTTSAAEVGYAVRGSKWAVIGTSGGWHRIFYEGREAWFSAAGRSTSTAYTAPGAETPVLAEEAVEISVASIPVRSGPGLTYATLGTATAGQVYVSKERRSNWRRIGWSREDAWVPEYAAVLRSASIDRVTNPWLNVRTGPGLSYDLIDSVPAGSLWAAVEFSGSWHRICFAGRSAWFSGTLVSTSDFGAPPSPSSVGFVRLPASGPGFIRRCGANNPDHAWATPGLVNGLMAAAQAWTTAHPDFPALRVGDLSNPEGGPMPSHESHQEGRCADLFLLRSDASADGAIDTADPAYSGARTRECLDAFLRPALDVEFVLLSDPAIYGALTGDCPGEGCPVDASGAHVLPGADGLPYVRCDPGHADHLHLKIR